MSSNERNAEPTDLQMHLLTEAFITLGHLGGNRDDSKYRVAWEAMRDVVNRRMVRPRVHDPLDWRMTW